MNKMPDDKMEVTVPEYGRGTIRIIVVAKEYIGSRFH